MPWRSVLIGCIKEALPLLSTNLHGNIPQFSAAPKLFKTTALGTVGLDQGAEIDDNVRHFLQSAVDLCKGESNFEVLLMPNG